MGRLKNAIKVYDMTAIKNKAVDVESQGFATQIKDVYMGVKNTLANPVTYVWSMGLAVSPALAKAAEMKQTAMLSNFNTEVIMTGYVAAVIGLGVLLVSVMRRIDQEEVRENKIEDKAYRNNNYISGLK